MAIKATIRQVREIWTHFREHGLRDTLRWFHSKEAPGIVQFGKYGVAGVIATVVSQGIWLALSCTWFPAFTAEEMEGYRRFLAAIHIDLPPLEIEGLELTDDERARNSTIANVIGWFFGNIVAYLVNVWWVFEGGRHHRVLEFVFFTVISGFSTLAGIAAGPLLIKLFGISTGLSQLSLLVTAVLVNYVCRKFFVFSR